MPVAPYLRAKGAQYSSHILSALSPSTPGPIKSAMTNNSGAQPTHGVGCACVCVVVDELFLKLPKGRFCFSETRCLWRWDCLLRSEPLDLDLPTITEVVVCIRHEQTAVGPAQRRPTPVRGLVTAITTFAPPHQAHQRSHPNLALHPTTSNSPPHYPSRAACYARPCK